MTTTYLPYPAYQPSGIDWLGNIPSGWKAISLRHLAKIKNGSDFKHIEVEEGGYPVLGSGGEFARVSAFMFDKPSVLLGRKGTIDNPLYIEEPFWTVDTLFYTEIQENTYPKFFYYFCKTIPFSFFQYGSTVPSMTQNDLYSVRVSFPSLLEQQQIAAFLDRETAKIDQLIAKQQQLIELLKEKRQAVISHAVTKGLNPDVKMNPSGVEWLGDVPEHWTIAQLKLFTTLMQTGPFGSQLHAEDYTEEGVPVINPAHITPDRTLSPDPLVSVTQNTASRLERHQLNTGDLILGRRGELGRCAVIHQEQAGWICGTGSLKITVKPSLNPEYTAYLISSEGVRAELSLASKGSTMDNLNTEILGSIRIPIPPVHEQQTILENISNQKEKYHRLLEKAQRQIGLLRERRAALISAAVTGKIDVREVALLA